MDRAVPALLALFYIVSAGCKDDDPVGAANDLASDKAVAECADRFANSSCDTAAFADEAACAESLTATHETDNDKFFDAGAKYNPECASLGLESWPFSGRCQSICAVFTGDAAETESCDIEEGVLCQQGLLCHEGRCTEPRNLIADVGEPCAGGQNRVCAQGLACDGSLCVTAPAIGAACLPIGADATPTLCDTEHYCDDNGLCQETRAVGQTCTRAEMCHTFACVTGQCAPGSREPLVCWGEGTLYACETAESE